MQVVVKKEIKSAYTGRVLQVKKVINPELCVDTMKIARESAIGAKEKNDCVVRAFMAALDTSYDSTHAFVKKYNEYFTHNNKRWEVIHKTAETICAVELSTRGLAQGAVERFPV